METRAKTVLIVDDDESIRTLLAQALELEGYVTHLACDGRQALGVLDDMVASEGMLPDLVVLDLLMPKMDGQSFLAELEARGLRAYLPVILLTAHIHGKRFWAMLRTNDYIGKPFDLTDLIEKINGYLSS